MATGHHRYGIVLPVRRYDVLAAVRPSVVHTLDCCEDFGMNDDFGLPIGLFLAAIVCALLPNTKVTAHEWAQAAEVCALNGGIDYVRGEGAIRSLKIVCNNGAEVVR